MSACMHQTQRLYKLCVIRLIIMSISLLHILLESKKLKVNFSCSSFCKKSQPTTHTHTEPANRFLDETLMEDLAAGQRWPALHVADFMLLGRREYLILFVSASFMTIGHLRPLYSTGALVVSCSVKEEGSEAQMFSQRSSVGMGTLAWHPPFEKSTKEAKTIPEIPRVFCGFGFTPVRSWGHKLSV